jgi:DNA-binding CsgD family transcriptional regulator
MTAAEKKCLRTTGYICTGYKTNTEIAKGWNITTVLDKIMDYRRNWV